MANRSFMDKSYSLLKGETRIYATFLVTGTTPALMEWTYPVLGSGGNAFVAAPTTGGTVGFPGRYAQGADGVFSVARTAAGLWTITLQDFYARLLSIAGHCSIAGGTSNIVAIAENSTITAMATAANGGSVIGLALLSATATLADPTTLTTVKICMSLQNASMP